jgi:predicted transcriptional regulator
MLLNIIITVKNMRRNNFDINAEILQVANEGAKKTQIVYKANLNFLLVKKYLKNLIEKGFMSKTDTRYYTTEKGRDFLMSYQEFSSMTRGLA